MNDSQGEDPRRGVSRRGFLTGTGAAAAVAGLTAEWTPPAPAQEALGAPAHGPAPVRLELTVNGKKVTTNVEPRVTLLDALRNYLDVTGCKRVCDRATCGACTVVLNGRTVYSCMTLALEASGADVRTAESLGGDGRQLDPVPAAFAANDA
ncbi:MAG: 2Fe-2S iron-sulfur cluster binding domain-containing protein, partial [Zavarzinella sp.]|nr:2Fe-2S iron-sulfur cluster binding domain-containing protein [Zavarzinella sp.]